MAHANYDPVRLRYHGWKKTLAGPIERFFLRRAKALVVTCEAEKGWIESYLGRRCPPIELTDIKRFFNLNPVNPVNPVKKDLHLLYLGRRHPLKGLSYLETALATYYNKWSSAPSSLAPTTACADNPSSNPSRKATTYYNKCPIEFRVVSDAFGDELERVWDWCDVLVLPTLSENFGLVIAEALERGKCVITTDGAPAWGENLSRVERVDGGMWSGYGGRLIYLKGYRDGTPEDRVRLLKSAIENLLSRASLTPPAAK
jgi:glycosyltransferase involved in cell wall biosynthesis